MLEKSLKVLAWVQIVLGSFGMIGWIDNTSNGAALIGGLLFIGCGIVALVYIAKNR